MRKNLKNTIENEKELEAMLKEEVSKLELNDKKISAKFGNPLGGIAHAAKLQDGSYEVILGIAKRTTLQHELYHIYRGDLECSSYTKLKYLFLHEPRALFYEFLGIKL
jgi:hypothetical protein